MAGTSEGNNKAWLSRPRKGQCKQKTHCKKGHELTSENVTSFVAANGYTYRQCRTCNRERGKSGGYRRELMSRWDTTFGWPKGTAEWLISVSVNCALCGEPFTKQREYSPVFDHSHSTGRFRGLIHNKCNSGIGMLSDSEERCLQAAAYLREPTV